MVLDCCRPVGGVRVEGVQEVILDSGGRGKWLALISGL